MKRSALLITAVVVISIAGGYFLYLKVFNKPEVKAWDIVPIDALAVYEKSACNPCVAAIQKSAIWSFFNNMLQYRTQNDSLHAKLRPFWEMPLPFLASLHQTKKDELDVVFYLKTKADVVDLADDAIRHQRVFNGAIIYEMKFGKEIFSFSRIADVWFGSHSPILVEDVIRTSMESQGLLKKNVFTQQFGTIQEDGGNLYLHLKKVNDLLSIFIHPLGLQIPIGKSAVLDIKADAEQLVLNGFSIDSTRDGNELLTIFNRQSPVTFGLDDLISNRTITVTSYGISDSEKFSADLHDFQKRNNRLLFDSLQLVGQAHGIEFENVLNTVGREIDLLLLESVRSQGASKVLLIETSSTSTWDKAFQKIAEKLSVDTIFFEQYAQYEIREVPIPRLTEKLFWPLVTGFSQNYYTQVGNVIVIAENLEELKRILDEIDLEDTWGKSVRKHRFLESTLLEANYSFYVNPEKSWNFLQQIVQPKWQNFLIENRNIFKSLQLFSLQFSHLNNNYYTNGLFTFKAVDEMAANFEEDALAVSNFQHGILSMHAVKSHVSRNNEVLMQDSLFNLSLLSAEGKTLWHLSLGDKIVSDVIQLDYYNNGKLQYLLATPNAIHVIDRLGNYVEGFPVHLSLSDIEHISLVDYDNSKRYRFLAAEKNGRLWMLDKEGKPLDPWSPKDLGGSLAMPARHHRIKGRDYIIAIQKDGLVHLTNRRGEPVKKFPLNSESIPSGDYFLELGRSIEDTYFIVVSNDGFRVRFTLDGKVQSREALPKTSVSSTFSLILERSSKGYLILQQDGRQSSLSDESGKKIITTNIGHLQPADVRYYDFGAGRSYIVLRDRIQSFIHIYDGNGNLLTSPPLDGNIFELSRTPSDAATIFLGKKKRLSIQHLSN